LSWLTLPQGFCAHYFGTVPDARQLRFAPGGELFVASPTTPTTGGNTLGALAGIAVLPDDNHDGFAESPSITFMGNLPSVQGLLFANGAFYFQDGASIRSVPYRAGDRQPAAAPQLVTTITALQDTTHWPKVLDIAVDGTIYVTNGGSQEDACESTWPIRGAVFALGAGGATTMVSMGFRNPIALRCEANHNVCLAAELALDFSGGRNGREKVVPVRPGDNWGYPCCATQGVPYAGVTYAGGGVPDCSTMAPESDSFVIGHTPFGLDFETGKWPAPWTGRVFVTLHGTNATWEGARVVAIALDPSTGLPLPATELDAGAGANSMLQFASGWDDGTHSHGRPAPVTFAPDGRMFLGDDNKGVVVWIAPTNLMQK
jgi:glucose/arabinose dehydrogenase